MTSGALIAESESSWVQSTDPRSTSAATTWTTNRPPGQLAMACDYNWEVSNSGAVITRMSVVERNAEIDLGTVVENSSVLPLSYVGPGLDVCNAVLGYSKIASLARNATVAVCDPKLTAELSPSRFVRAVGGYAETLSRAAGAVMTSFSAKRNAKTDETAKVEHAPRLEKSRAAAKAS